VGGNVELLENLPQTAFGGGREWTTWCTLTFAKDMSFGCASRAIHRFGWTAAMHVANEHLVAAVVLEQDDWRREHAHVLFGTASTGALSERALGALWDYGRVDVAPMHGNVLTYLAEHEGALEHGIYCNHERATGCLRRACQLGGPPTF
jgi:hypothetical protein